MQLQRCDSCGATAPSTGHVSAGNWVNQKGSDKWAKLGFTIFREAKPPNHVELREGQAFYAQVFSNVDLCSDCLGNILAVLGEEARSKISFKVADQGDFVILPKEAFEELKKEAGHG